MPTMSLSTDLSNLPGKRLFDHGGCQYRGFPANFKRPKVDAIRQFPKQFGLLAPRVTAIPSKGVSGVVASGIFEVGEAFYVKPAVILVPSDIKFESAETMVSHDNVKELPTMSLLPNESPLSKLPGKRLFDHGGCQHSGFPPNFKRPKVDAIRHIPRHCRVLAPQITKKFEPANTMVSRDNVKELPTISLLPNESPLSKLPGKRLFDHGGCQRSGFPPNFKRPKVDAIRHIPRHCRVLAPQITKKSIEGVSGVAITGNSKVGEEGAVVPVEPLGTSVPKDMKFESTKPMVKTTTTDGKQMEGQILDLHAFERKLEVNALEEMVDEDQVKCTQLVASETCKQVQGGTSSKYKTKQEKDRVETSIVSPSEIKLLPPDSVCQTVSTKINEDSSLVGRAGKVVEYCEDKDAEDGSEMVMSSQVAQHFDIKPPCDWAIVKQEGEMISNCETVEATCKYKSQNHEADDTDKSNYVLLQKQDITEASKQNYTTNSLVLSAESSNQCEYTPFDDKEKHKHIIVAKESNVFSIVPFDNIQEVVSQNKVREALNLFEETFTKISKEREAQSKEKGKVAKQNHVEAAELLKKQQKWVNTDRLLGPVPGVEVGHQFRFRAELVVIGLHHQYRTGIDYMKKDGKIFATSIVASGRYANDAGSSDVLKYSGQGGNPTVGSMELEDQKLERGNLALKNSMDAGTPVRVIRGRQNSKGSNILGTYIYDGLYIVTSCIQERGKYGKLVFMFHLNRIPGQPKLAWEIFSPSAKSKGRKLPSVVDDISQGKEEMPIHVVNTVDDEKPPPFVYITNMVYPEWYNHAIPIGCDCKNGCSYSEKCLCTIKNGGDIPFNCNGAIVERKPLVYECGPSCKCSSSCKNRVSQHGIRYQLEVFKTESRGWGVRSHNYISSGSFICEYAGELLQDKEAELRGDNDEYLFDIGNENDDDFPQDKVLADGFTIDAAYCGNVGRFINHSCSPNLYAQNVLYDHDEKRMPHVMLFAARSILPLQELTYDYNYKLDQVRDVNGNIKKKNCYCGSLECCGRMY